MQPLGREMKENQIQTYLRSLKSRLWIYGLVNADTLAEIESHLLESVEAGLRQGLSLEEAEKRALDRFGSVKTIVKLFEKERIDRMQILLLTVATLAGLFSAYVDSRPTWDDTGILAFGILIICGLLTLLGHRQPWLIALAVGIWIPLHGIFISHNYGSILALAFAFAGAYGGWAVRLGIRKTFDAA
jgi:HAAS